MQFLFKSALLRLALFLFIGLVVGLQLDAVGWALLVALALHTAWFLRGYYRFLAWIDGPDLQQDAFASHAWASLAARIRKRVATINEEKKQLQLNNRFLADILDTQDYAIVVIDSDGGIAWANRSAKPVMGIDLETDLGRNLFNLYRAPAFQQYLSRGNFKQAMVIESPYNRELKLEICVRGFNGQRLLVARDVTEDVKLQTMREDFIANVSHELKTPLTVIAGYIDLLRDNEQQIPAAWLNSIEQMGEQSQRMQDLVRDLIMLSRLETVQPEFKGKPVDIVGLLQKIVEEAQLTAPGKSITLSIDGEQFSGNLALLHGSEAELHSAFNNIIQNAIRYTGPQGEIDVRCYVYFQTFRVSVSDNGEGIAQEHIHRLTERFYRVDESRTAASGGTGLGLAIVKHVLSRHQGILQVASTVGKGSTFTCVFPLARVQWQPSEADS